MKEKVTGAIAITLITISAILTVGFVGIAERLEDISLKQDQTYYLLQENCIPPRNDAQMLNGYNQ